MGFPRAAFRLPSEDVDENVDESNEDAAVAVVDDDDAVDDDVVDEDDDAASVTSREFHAPFQDGPEARHARRSWAFPPATRRRRPREPRRVR